MTLKIVQLQDTAAQPWKNGGGITHHLLAWPSAAAWALRISLAEVARSGPFSAYPGISRWFTVVQGDGVLLRFADHACRLTIDSAPLHFDGAAVPACELLDGPTLDLNLMSDPAAGKARMQRAEPGVAWADEAPLRAVFTTRPATLVVQGRAAAHLPAMSLAWAEPAASASWCLAGTDSATRAWWLAFTPAAT